MKSLCRSLLITLLLCLAWASWSNAANVRLEHADSLATTQTPTGMDYEFFGNVHFVRDSSDLYSDYAVRQEPSNTVRFLGNVKMREPQRTLTADSVWYDQKTDLLRAWGKVVIEDRLRHVRAAGGAATYEGTQDYLLLLDHPRLMVDFDLPQTVTTVSGDTIKYHERDDLVEAVDSAIITQGTLVAHSQQATIFLDREEICLTGNVRASQRQNELSGDNMTVYSKDKKLREIDVTGNGESIFRQPAATAVDSVIYNTSRLTGDKINFYFANDVLDQIRAQGNTYSYYLPAPEDTVSKGSNTASGDSTILKFANSELNEVFVVTSAEGTYWAPAGRDSLGRTTRMDTVTYSANRINYKIPAKLIIMQQTARVKQATMNLEAHEIEYNLNTRIVYAFGHYDSTQSQYVPLTLKDQAEEMTGERLVYNLDDKRGKIKESRTKMEQAYYSGGVVRKEVDNELLVHSGNYTTCDLAEPHFHFASSNMKLITNDKVFARPVVLYIESLPVFALPYFVFSTKKGRQSGFLPFQFGNFERGQRFVNNLGYYWAISDYWDVRASVNVSEAVGLNFNAGARYAIRNTLSGNINGSFARQTQFIGVQRTFPKRYQFNFQHSQTLDPSLTLNGSGTYVSDKSYYTDYTANLDQRLNRQIRSQVNITKRWEGASLFAAADQTKNLDNDSHSEKLPTVRFSLSQKPLIRQPKKLTDRRWYNDVYYSYGNSFLNSVSKSVVNQTATVKKYAVFNEQLDIRAPIKFLSAVTLSPSISTTDNWYYLPHSDQADSAELAVNTLKSRQTWSSSLSLSTVLYGTVAPHILSVTGIRHVMTPSFSLGHQPKITRNQEYAGFTGVGGSGFESKNLSIGLGNQFQMKYLKGGKEKKVDLFKYSLSTSYDFVRAEPRWGDVSSFLSAPNVKNLTMDVSFTHGLYDSDGNLRWWNPTLKSISVTAGFRGAIRIPVGLHQSQPPATPVQQTLGSVTGAGSALGTQPLDQKTLSIGISERYSETRGVYGGISNWISVDLAFSPSKNWQVKYRQNYNVRLKQSTEKVIEVYRDLHCWEGVFTWIPEGSLQGYYFRLNVKLMPDLKFEKSESGIRDALFRMIPTQ